MRSPQLLLTLCVAGILPVTLSGQTLTRSPAAPPGFGVGERAEYQVKLGAFSVGSGTMEVLGIERMAGHPTYRARLHVVGGIPLARVDTKMDTWIDISGETLFSRSFEQNQHELRYRRHRIFDFSPERLKYRQRGGKQEFDMATSEPLDDVSFLYYARTLPLNVGDTYTIARYYRDESNPIVLTVLREETITVPAGRFETVVVRPIVKTRGLFSEGGEGEVFVTKDERRLIVQIRVRMPLVGSLSLHLRNYTPGEKVAAEE